MFVCSSCGFHYTNYLDLLDSIDSKVDPSSLNDLERSYIASQLESNRERFERQTRLVQGYIDWPGRRVLDVGCGGGRFLSIARDRGAETIGLELSDSRIQYARTVYRLNVQKYPIDHSYWQEQYRHAFDVITLWDVIEHVNCPDEMIQNAANLLVSGGFIFIDTPCRDAAFHRLGSLFARLTRGHLPLLLNVLYSNRPFGHKQILAAGDLVRLLTARKLDVLAVQRFHELSFPHRHYLKRALHSGLLVELAHPLTKLMFTLIPLANKMICVARKPCSVDERECEAT